MAEPVCPPSCHEKIEAVQDDVKLLFGLSIPAWVRGIFIGMIGMLFILYAGLYAYANSEFATKNEVKEMKAEMRGDMREVQAKLDVLLQRTVK